jgi:hypothetical protein
MTMTMIGDEKYSTTKNWLCVCSVFAEMFELLVKIKRKNRNFFLIIDQGHTGTLLISAKKLSHACA